LRSLCFPQQGGSGLLQPPTTEIAPDIRFPPPPKADPRAKRQRHGKSSARLPLGVELAEADAKRRKQDASADSEVARAEAVSMVGHSNVEVPGLQRRSRQQAIAVKSKAVASEGERTTTANAEGGRGGRGGLGRRGARGRGSGSNSGRGTVRGARR
jgi:hypothetical protein